MVMENINWKVCCSTSSNMASNVVTFTNKLRMSYNAWIRICRHNTDATKHASWQKKYNQKIITNLPYPRAAVNVDTFIDNLKLQFIDENLQHKILMLRNTSPSCTWGSARENFSQIFCLHHITTSTHQIRLFLILTTTKSPRLKWFNPREFLKS